MLLTAAVANCAPAWSQATMKSILTGDTPLTWVGLDFSIARLTTRADFAPLEGSGPAYFARWNNLLETEASKYDLTGALVLNYVKHATAMVRPFNDNVDLTKSWSAGDAAIDPEKIPALIQRYDTQGHEGAGVVFIVSNLNKPQGRGDFYVVFFDMRSKEVLHSEMISGKPFGAGLRNFWAGAVNSVVKEIKGKYQKAWVARYINGK